MCDLLVKILMSIPMFESGGSCSYCSLFSIFLGFKRLLHPSHILNFVAWFSVHLLRDGLQFFSFSSIVKEY